MKGDTMRPLIDILEDERTLMHKLEFVYRHISRDDDPELLSVLNAKRKNLKSDLDETRNELREYIEDLFKNS